jgi:hypothetical protein
VLLCQFVADELLLYFLACSSTLIYMRFRKSPISEADTWKREESTKQLIHARAPPSGVEVIEA